MTTDHAKDWDAIAAAMAPVEVSQDPLLLKKRARDYFWYSPVLNAELRGHKADLVAQPKTPEELARCLSVAYENDVPIVLRGGGTGNYGQSVPVNGGLIIDTTGCNRILEISDGFVRVEAGALMADINSALKPHGWELAMFPSTQDIATIGGFVAGGSAGIGSVANGPLRQPGNIRQIKAYSVEAVPELHVFNENEVLDIHHAWGLNGAIVEVTMRTVPTHEWIGVMATFEDYAAAYAAGYALASDKNTRCKLVSVVDSRIATYFRRLASHIEAGRDLLVSLVPQEDVAAVEALIVAAGGRVDLAMTDEQRVAENIPHVFEFGWNHTTLQVLKSDRSATYQQYGVTDPSDTANIARLHAELGEKVWMHHEFSQFDGRITASDLPIIWYEDEAHLRSVDALYAANGCTVHDAHTNRIEGGGMKPDYRHLAVKKRLDPKGLLNPGKSDAWEDVCHLSPEAILALGQGA